MTGIMKNTPDHQACFLFVVGDIFHDIFHPAIEDSAEGVNGMGADTFVPFQPGDLPGADIIALNKSVLGDAPLFHYIP